MKKTLAILSWASPKTLVNTLESYRKFGLPDLFDQRVIFFQEMTIDDAFIAKEYGYEAHGVPTNIGIALGYKSLVELATGDLFLFLENDWELIEPADRLKYLFDLLATDETDVVRLRHTKNPGEPLWSRQYQGHEMDKPEFLLDATYWTNDVDRFWPLYKINDVVMTTASFANWTNNPTMFRTSWLRENIVPRMGTHDVELDIQLWWKEQSQFTVTQHIPGFFTHNRLDR